MLRRDGQAPSSGQLLICLVLFLFLATWFTINIAEWKMSSWVAFPLGAYDSLLYLHACDTHWAFHFCFWKYSVANVGILDIGMEKHTCKRN